MADLARMAGRERARTSPVTVWLFCWVLLPNACFIMLWLLGAPPRGFVIAVTGVWGLVARHWGYRCRLAAFVLLLGYAVLSYLAGLFNQWTTDMLVWIPYLQEMHPERSLLYLIGAAGVVATVAIAATALKADAAFVGWRDTVTAVAGIVFAVSADYVVSHPMSPYFNRVVHPDASFSSGVLRSGFASRAHGRHLLLVMVESLGVPRDPAVRDAIFAPLHDRAITDRYTLTAGTSPYYGTTVNGEMRALCGRWAGYEQRIVHRDDNCLPAQLRARGYHTLAVHSFDGAMFERDRWYPNIGFDRTLFRDDLIADGVAPCPGVFPGACDRDVPRLLARRLKSANGPQFIYWLTVNSHLPVVSDARMHTAACPADAPDDVAHMPMLCRQFVLWRDVIAALARELAADDLPPVDVLIVGDHMPPYFDVAQRSEFDPAQVPWVMLRARRPDDARQRRSGRLVAHQNFALSVTSTWRGLP